MRGRPKPGGGVSHHDTSGNERSRINTPRPPDAHRVRGVVAGTPRMTTVRDRPVRLASVAIGLRTSEARARMNLDLDPWW